MPGTAWTVSIPPFLRIYGTLMMIIKRSHKLCGVTESKVKFTFSIVQPGILSPCPQESEINFSNLVVCKQEAVIWTNALVKPIHHATVHWWKATGRHILIKILILFKSIQHILLALNYPLCGRWVSSRWWHRKKLNDCLSPNLKGSCPKSPSVTSTSLSFINLNIPRMLCPLVWWFP